MYDRVTIRAWWADHQKSCWCWTRGGEILKTRRSFASCDTAFGVPLHWQQRQCVSHLGWQASAEEGPQRRTVTGRTLWSLADWNNYPYTDVPDIHFHSKLVSGILEDENRKTGEMWLWLTKSCFSHGGPLWEGPLWEFRALREAATDVGFVDELLVKFAKQSKHWSLVLEVE